MPAGTRGVEIQAGDAALQGDLTLPEGARGCVLFAHGSGSGRLSPRNRYVAQVLNEAGLATLLIDLLTEAEEAVDVRTRHLRFDIPFLAGRLAGATEWLLENPETGAMRIGYFGASTGAGAALIAAAEYKGEVGAVVSRGGRPDLAKDALPLVEAPTLLIVGGRDEPVIGLNRTAYERMRAKREFVVVPGATHLFEEPGKLSEVARIAADWFSVHLAGEQLGHPAWADPRYEHPMERT